MNVILNELIKRAPLDFRRLLLASTALVEVNLIPTAFNTDWSIEYRNASNDYVLRNVPVMYANGTCNCAVSSECQAPLRIGPPELVLPGLVVGCLPIDGLRMSTLECFFSSNCINTILNYLEYYTLPDKSKALNFTLPEVLPLILNPLNESIPSHFSPVTLIGTIIDELFIEKWENITSYENYYDACSPTICNYKYSQRRGVLYVITSLLSLYGGLTTSLRFIVWNGMKLYQTIKSARRIHHTTVASQNSIN
ncbi:unnamed protein product [Rotaria sp. Silwood2]|nr:unnamed protein product [Rotaria sp. Silwood2]CAF4191682.1 unnamed protein product [Rotaria sp. Silwood2]